MDDLEEINQPTMDGRFAPNVGRFASIDDVPVGDNIHAL
jgi:hypothetical protein